MKHKLIAMAAAFLLSLTPLTASASHVILIEPEVNLEDYTTSYTALKEADHIMYSGNQVLIHWELPVMTQGCEIIPNTMEWEVSGTADVTFETDSFFKSVSYEENYANTYCLITANSPGSVHVIGTEYSLHDSDGTEMYFNFTVDADGNFDETVDMDNPIEPIISGDSVYFPKPDTPCQFDLIVSSNQESAVTHDKDGCTFTPEEDGRYVVSTREYCEEIVGCGTSDVSGHFHYFYPVLNNYTVAVKDGEITVTEKGSRSWFSEEQISKEVTAIDEALSSGDIQVLACYDVYAADPDDVMHGAYFSFVNGQLPAVQGDYKSYITNVYTEYGTKSYFCVNYFYSDIVPFEPRVLALEKEIVYLTTEYTTSSTCDGDLTACSPDMMQMTRIYADETLEGDLTVIVDGKEEYLLTVKDGIFRRRKEASGLTGDCNNDGKFSVTDLVMLQKYLLGRGELTAVQNADICADGTVNAFDLAVMKRELLQVTQSADISFTLCDSAEIRTNADAHTAQQAYVIRSMQELQTAVEENERCGYMDSAVKGIDEAFFADHALILLYTQAGAGNKYTIAENIAVTGTAMCVSTVTKQPQIATPDMMYRRFALAVDQEAVGNVSQTSCRDTMSYYAYEESGDVQQWFDAWRKAAAGQS